MVTDFSLAKKSSPLIDVTSVFESFAQAPMRCGLFLAKTFTAFGARRSELPWRKTGLTALPKTIP